MTTPVFLNSDVHIAGNDENVQGEWISVLTLSEFTVYLLSLKFQTQAYLNH